MLAVVEITIIFFLCFFMLWLELLVQAKKTDTADCHPPDRIYIHIHKGTLSVSVARIYHHELQILLQNSLIFDVM